MRVLLVDDELELVTTMAERLSIRGIDADWAINAEEALRKAETNRYDVAVLDVKIPKGCGIRLKKDLEKKVPSMKFIFVTGHGSEADFQAGCAEAGAAYYLVKPVDLSDLIIKMKKLTGEEE
jgi:DNA-binding response OmpR family regulator